MALKDASPIEQKIAKAIIRSALQSGYTVSVYDDGEWCLKRSSDPSAIMEAMATTDQDTLRFRDADGNVVGNVLLVYGNNQDLICDYSDVERMSVLLREASDIAEAY